MEMSGLKSKDLREIKSEHKRHVNDSDIFVWSVPYILL